ncbi:hypothetical protein CAS74_001171 [Pichia kudriavzevii]|uniref:Arrestin-like N-terminal domain-containing protein n=2 Tax=Pichia kudriavzevii TaxID=4909 RepID=A0A1Z8JW13_PICKU|nr:hypothetical protein CAS74_001171 [Pichia kudriavzevii]
MGNWFTNSTKIDVKLIDPPPALKYSPANPIVQGYVNIEFLETVKKVCDIKCGIVGTVRISYYANDIACGALQATAVDRKLIVQTFDFFRVYQDIPLQCGDIQVTDGQIATNDFNKGDKVKSKFCFEFPNTLWLPSSCRQYGDIDGDITIAYAIYVDIYKLGKITGKPKVQDRFRSIITYQGGKDPCVPKGISNLKYTESELFHHKVKKFYYDEAANALIPSSITKSHSKTRFIRRLWDDNYKSETFKNITKDIPLAINFSVGSILDMNEPFSSYMQLKLISDLRSVKLESNQTTDFVFNGQSTCLGRFEIESLTVGKINHIRLQCYQHIMGVINETPLLRVKFSDLVTDIKDFSYSKEEGTYYYDVPVDKLIQCADIDLNQPLSRLLGDRTIQCSGSIQNWFSNKSTLTFIWKITDGQSQQKRYQIMSACELDCLSSVSQMAYYPATGAVPDAISAPPPTYERSGNDKVVV